MNTFADILTALKDRVMSNIQIFDNGYSFARMDENKGFVATSGKEEKYISINDTEGNYFYIRTPNMTGANVVPAATDCGVKIAERFSCVLVAVVKDADPMRLYDAILNELLKTKVITFKGGSTDPVYIVENEFKGLKKESVEAAKKRIGDNVIVRLDFDVTRYFETHNCEYQICPSC